MPKKEEPSPLIVLRKELELWHENKAKQLQEYERLMKQQKIDNENLEMLVGLFSYHLLRKSLKSWVERTCQSQLLRLKLQRAAVFHRRQVAKSRFHQWKKYAQIEKMFLAKLDQMQRRKIVFVIMNAWKRPMLQKQKAIKIMRKAGATFGKNMLVYYFKILQLKAHDRKIINRFRKKRFLRKWHTQLEQHRQYVHRKVAEKMLAAGSQNVATCFSKWKLISEETNRAKEELNRFVQKSRLCKLFHEWLEVFLHHQKQRKAVAIWCLGAQTQKFLRWRDWVQESHLVQDFRLKIYVRKWKQNVVFQQVI